MACYRLARTVALAVLLSLAGCGGLGGSDSADGGTVTPAPVPTDGAQYPPGIGKDGVAADVVAETHERRMNETNYTFVSRQRVAGPNGTMWVTNRTRRIANDEGAYAGRIDHRVEEFPLGRFAAPIEYWGNESVYASRRILSERTQFHGWSRTDQTDDLTSLPLIERTLAATELSVVDRPDGVRLVGRSLREPDRLPSPPYLTDPRNVSLTVRVTDEGMITRWRLAYDATLTNRTVRVTREARLTAIGSTTVRRPDWVDRARAETLARQGE
ncbi:hypothetical protein [Halosimplex amylolyticum]|uniref:hypothetical protein n=1 Tax=Halosimplex amylolyticum TaxID=3396616 RepID=UPI003F576F15